jgi:hypothetical protein
MGQATYQSWKSSRLFQRSKLCWDSLRSWAENNFQEVANSLMPGMIDMLCFFTSIQRGNKMFHFFLVMSILSKNLYSCLSFILVGL